MLFRDYPATEEECRARLATLIGQHREDYAGLSRLLGRPAGYLARWVRDGSPKLLPETDRRTLARYFNVEPQMLGVPLEDVEPRPAYVKPPLRERV